MRIVYMKSAKTLAMTDGMGKSIHKRGDDKIMCPGEGVAHIVVEAISQLTGKFFFEVSDHEDLVIWEGG